MKNPIEKIDWELLREQKELLFGHSINVRNTLDNETLLAMDGIVNLLDELQDYAVDKLGIDENKVFNLTNG